LPARAYTTSSCRQVGETPRLGGVPARLDYIRIFAGIPLSYSSIMKRLLLLVLAVFAFGCSSDSTTEPGTNSPHKIPKVGSTFDVQFITYNIDTVFELKVTATGQEIEGHKNVILFERGFGPAYDDNGDISLEYNYGWITIPVKTQQPLVIPTVTDEWAVDHPIKIDQTIIPDGEEMRVIGSKTYKCLKFIVKVDNTLFYPNGEFYNEHTMYGKVIWAPELGYFALVQYDSPDDTGTTFLTVNAELK
jgi:hypothetical protein